MHESRLYIDLIKFPSGEQYANWDPSNPIEAGDYGGINYESGKFEKQGNLYRDDSIAEITTKYPPIHGSETKDMQYYSLGTDIINPKTQFDPDIFGKSKPLVGGQWHFSKRRGAVLLIHKAKTTTVPGVLLEELKECEWVKGKCIVTHVHKSPAYAMYLSDKKEGNVSIALCPGPFSPNDTSSDKSGGEKPKWIAEGISASGSYRSASSDESNLIPLFRLKVVEKQGGKRRQSPDPINDEKLHYYDAKAPWWNRGLDSDGEEYPDIEEDISSDDD
ncbi:uncharacterized protein FOMMEDRAFT_170227 [Fomitiporia mediterranea MF3/22]|uniref:uncharacterized protein n=1 Tax=Fomitiporia mediterranea (strain MF3/22) TaxID=694068 RepID=UPI0004408891|nr:uncharacterized protein FOMMEDRAFT_170227 [Fomitiporia mediterranea MF3/22]EJD00261.1 hypothetical protein FOMMEDRAFT_170227 [Fomitiporia mediterranea MF3/22]